MTLDPRVLADCDKVLSTSTALLNHTLPALLHALALGRPADEQRLLGTIANLVQTLGAPGAIEIVEDPPL